MAMPPPDGGPAPPDKLLTWSTMTYDTGAFNGVWAAGSDAFAVGDKGAMGAIWRRSGGGPLNFASDGTYTGTTMIRAVSGTDLSNVWAAGDSATILYLKSGTWSAPPGTPPANAGTYYGIWTGGPGSPSVEVVGGTRNGTCMDSTIDAHYDGTSWHGGSIAMNACAFGAVWGNNLGFIAWPGNEHKIFWTNDDDVNEFSYSFKVTSNVYLHGIWGLGKNLMWVVGDGGTIYRFNVDKLNGGNSSLENSTTTVQLNGVSGTGPGDVWAVGGSGTIVHSFGDGTWTQQTNIGNGNMTLNGVYAVAPNDVYIVGSLVGSKLILHGQ